MKLKASFAAVATLGAGLFLGVTSTHKAEALTPYGQDEISTDSPAQIAAQASVAGFLKDMPYCCSTGEIGVGFPAVPNGDGYDVTIDPKAYGMNSPEVTIHVKDTGAWTQGEWSRTHVFTEAEIAAVIEKCKADPDVPVNPQTHVKDTCDRPTSGSVVYAIPNAYYGANNPGGWWVYCLVPPAPTY